jgi:molybdenum cofactor guanylyltransferase
MNPTPSPRGQISAVILAGGRATRMGGVDKGLVEVDGKPMVEHVVAALRQQAADLFINANRNLDAYRTFGYPVLMDMVDGFCGPLAGMASAMRVARTPWLLTAPCDSPFVPKDLAARLHRAAIEGHAQIAVADSGGRLEPVFALIDVTLLPSLLEYLESGERKIDRWYGRHPMARVDFSDRPETFQNLNTPEDVADVERQLAATHAQVPS